MPPRTPIADVVTAYAQRLGLYGILRVRAKTIDNESWQPKTKKSRPVPASFALRRYLEKQVMRWKTVALPEPVWVRRDAGEERATAFRRDSLDELLHLSLHGLR